MKSHSFPKQGTLERLMLDKLLECPEGITYMDFIGTGITEDNIDEIANNLRNGIYENECYVSIGKDS